MDPRLTTAARLQQDKKYPAAEQIYRAILQSEPRNVDALLLLGLLLHETGRNEQSIETLQTALKLQPQHRMVRQTLVGPLMAMNRVAEAIAEARELVRQYPMVADMHFALGKLLVQGGDVAGALPHARRAVELQPKAPVMVTLLGRILSLLNQWPEALMMLDRALAMQPKNAEALIEKAMIRQAQGQMDEAILLYETALREAPNNVAAVNNLGSCYLFKQRFNDAIRNYEAAARLSPQNPMPRNNIGAVLKEAGRIDEAIVHFQHAARLDPNYADAWCNIGGCFATIAEHKQAIAAFREALRLRPDFAEVRSNLLLSLLPPTDVSPQEVFAEHREWHRAHAASLADGPAPWRGLPKDRRIRIAYISPDFREHSVRYFIQPIFAAHDRSQFEIICYATGRRRDEVTDQLAKLVDRWHFIAELTNEQLAQLIRSHEIDILVDLAGHTADHRLLTFARKPAPVQVTYLGYPTTTGLSAIDYRLTDNICDPPGADVFYVEKLIRLPNAFFVYSDDPAAAFDPTLPADRKGHFTFGSFNSYTKFNEETLDSWATILRGAPDSRLFMKARPLENPSTRQRMVQFFAQRGISEDRLDLRAWVELREHQTMLGSAIDLMLDTHPYNGHTTSCQAIWRGVPMVTRAGDSFRGRVGECILRHLDLTDFLAHSKQEYEQIAIRLGKDWGRLRELRPTLRDRFQCSPLGDAKGFVAALEHAYRQMLQGPPTKERIKSAEDWAQEGLALHRKAQIAEAERAYRQALAIDPNHPDALNNLAAVLLLRGNTTDAIPLLHKAADLRPKEPGTRNNLGHALDDLCRFDEAIAQYEAASELDPNFTDALNNAGGAYALIGEHDKATECYRKALHVNPQLPIVHSNLLLSMIQREDLPEMEILCEHQEWNRLHAENVASLPPVTSDANPHRRLRIGYVSPDFRGHSVSFFIAPILRHHDRSNVEIYCYAVSPRRDGMTAKLKALADVWCDASGLDDRQLAEQIRSDRIDVLVDLAGHTSEHRLLAFAARPAPVQITYLGYPATTGLSAMQYRLTDAIADPVGSESFCTEQLIRLPNAFFVFDGDPNLPFDPKLPALRNGFVTFGSINNYSKIGPSTLQRWADILRGVPNSRLVLIAKAMTNPRTRGQVAEFFATRGIKVDRLDLLGFLGGDDYYRRLSEMDLTLDPSPFNGHTTTCQSLWMGVPVLTLAGNRFRSRVGKSVLHHLGLEEFVADSSETYVARGIELATDLSTLNQVRASLRERFANSPLADGRMFAGHLEQAYRQLVQCPPVSAP